MLYFFDALFIVSVYDSMSVSVYNKENPCFFVMLYLFKLSNYATYPNAGHRITLLTAGHPNPLLLASTRSHAGHCITLMLASEALDMIAVLGPTHMLL